MTTAKCLTRKETLMKHLPALVASAVTLLVGTAATAAPLSNQQFSDQVRQLRQQMGHSQPVVENAALLCTNLPAHRSAEEPRCVALRLHLRAQISARAQEAPDLCVPAGISRFLSRITGAA